MNTYSIIIPLNNKDMKDYLGNMKHSLMQCLGHMLNTDKTILCIQSCIYIGRDELNDKYIEKHYKLKRGFTPEEFGRYIEDINFTINVSDLVGIIVWFTDSSYSWASDEEDRIRWEHHHRPNPDNFDL